VGNLFKNRSPAIIVIIVIVLILIGAFFIFGRKEAGKVTEGVTHQSQQTNKVKEKGKQEGVVKPGKFPKMYTVKKGDFLWKIAVKNYKNGYRWTSIATANDLKNPNVIFPGQKLSLPKIAPNGKYTVAKGDTLWGISLKFYGKGSSWTKIRDANFGKIGKLPNGNPLITTGQVLNIP